MEKEIVDGVTFYSFVWDLKYDRTSRLLVSILFQGSGEEEDPEDCPAHDDLPNKRV